jgi:nucleoside triphosphate pyrophosphatase
VSRRAATPIVLASTSPQRRAILEQLGIPFEVVAPSYDEHYAAGADPVALVREHAQGKARSAEHDRLVLGVDTAVVLDGRIYGKPRDEEDAARILRELAGKAHDVVSGLCLRAPGWEAVEHETTRVVFRSLAEREVAAYVETREWASRAGGYAIQGKGASLVERIEGDYLNVVGLPVALLVRLLAERLPGRYGFG